ncbi:hypothetical protein AB0E01_17845 [Nocardia vinacea]|uniref:hypothetical protein n=1 Tax=Nocardia vinacea TaxID=96468 RepID=UPI003401B549
MQDATVLLAEDADFAMVLSTGVNRDRGRAAMFDYLSGRPKANRKHRLLQVARSTMCNSRTARSLRTTR